ncbi:MAG TPA: nucleoside-diphosphate kinase [Dehalococcoidia bacterium]|nr:nucleoside-diphosphate kinase [Dehalococcoidia bacterium]
MERTLILVKPDAMQRGLAGEILSRLESRGLKIVALKLTLVSRATAEEHYAHHSDKSFFPGLISFITSTPVAAAVLEGSNAIQAVRQVAGQTNPVDEAARPGSIRTDLGLDTGRNLIHASDSVETAETEIKRFFRDDEIIPWERATDAWIFE